MVLQLFICMVIKPLSEIRVKDGSIKPKTTPIAGIADKQSNTFVERSIADTIILFKITASHYPLQISSFPRKESLAISVYHP